VLKGGLRFGRRLLRLALGSFSGLLFPSSLLGLFRFFADVVVRRFRYGIHHECDLKGRAFDFCRGAMNSDLGCFVDGVSPIRRPPGGKGGGGEDHGYAGREGPCERPQTGMAAKDVPVRLAAEPAGVFAEPDARPARQAGRREKGIPPPGVGDEARIRSCRLKNVAGQLFTGKDSTGDPKGIVGALGYGGLCGDSREKCSRPVVDGSTHRRYGERAGRFFGNAATPGGRQQESRREG
jgi:hypothetical protein